MEEVPREAIEDYLRENVEFLDGVVVSGGEPTIHPDLPDLLNWLRSLGTKIKLDTNGSNSEMLKDVIRAGMVDYVAMDLKAPLDEKYSQLVGCDAPLDEIKRSIEILMTSGIDYEFRTTMVPTYLSPDDYERMAAYVGTAKKLALQHFSPRNTLDPNLSVINPLPEAKVRSIAEKCKPYVRKLIIRGGV